MENEKIAVIKINLAGVNIPVWRRIETPQDLTLHQLHKIIQAAMGWADCAPYYFKIAGANYDLHEGDTIDLPNDIDSRETKLSDVQDKAGEHIYVYDFGDNWRHEIVFEKIIPAQSNTKYPRCAEGAGQCPPEDIGGASGYKEFLKVVKGTDYRQKKEFAKWLNWSEAQIDAFNPETFDLQKANESLSYI